MVAEPRRHCRDVEPFEIEEEAPVRRKVLSYTTQASELIFGLHQQLKAARRDEGEPETLTEIERADVTFDPLGIVHAAALLSRARQHCRRVVHANQRGGC